MRSSLLLTITVLSLAGCATLRVPSTSTQFKPESWAVRQAELQKIQQWQISGAFSVQYQKKSTIASYEWQQIATRYAILIQSSLNLYTLKVSGQPRQVTLWEARKKPVTANSAEQLLQDRLGWSIPISNLTYWVRGLPAPGPQQTQLDTYGHLVAIQQAGWQVTLSSYITVKQVDVPRILNIQGHGLKIKIAIKQWQST